jgi:hypothetical protein
MRGGVYLSADEFYKGDSVASWGTSHLWVLEGGNHMMFRITGEEVEIDLDAAGIETKDLNSYTIDDLKKIAKGQK